jgi:hypothetical protein
MLSPVPVILSALVIVVSAIVASIYHSAKAAVASPAKKLKTE